MEGHGNGTLRVNQVEKATTDSSGSLRGTAPMEKHQVLPTRGNMLARLGGIDVLLLGIVSAFLYLDDWFSLDKLSLGRFTDEFELVNGKYSGFRRNHAKGCG
jgi:hypothetical protein